MSSRKIAFVCLALCCQLSFLAPVPAATAPPVPAPTAAPPPSGGIGMDLSSVNHNVTATIGGAIRQGSHTAVIAPGSLITPAERVALFQILNTGHQSIVLGTNGNATGGSFTITQHLANLGLGSLVVPSGVTAVDTAHNLALSGSLTNAGSLFALSTSPAYTGATIGATSIFNQAGAIISSLPAAGYHSIAREYNLTLMAVNDIVNAGRISSAGSLSLIAGGNIVNALPSNVTGIAPVIQAVNNVNLISNAGNITNAGVIDSATGSINVASQTAANILVNNQGGSLQALKGAINIRDAGFTDAFGTTITGGDLLSEALNIYSGKGNILVDVNNISGVVNMWGCAASLQASSANLQMGTISLSGDPTIYNLGGNITLTSDLLFNGENLAIIATGDIVSSGCQVIDTSSSSNAGGNITMVAGAGFTTSGGSSSALPGNPDTTSVITITGAATGGGKIDLASVPIVDLSSASKYNAGGNITLVAYGGTTTGSGQVLMPSGVTVTTGSGGTDLNGNVTIFAGAASGTGINVGNINTQGVKNGTGNIYMLTANPMLTGCKNCTGNVQIQNGQLISGAFNTDSNQYPLNTTAGIVAGNLTSAGGSINLLAGGTLSAGTIQSVGANASGQNGGIALLAGASGGTALQTADLVTSGSSAANTGNITVITSKPDTSYCASCPLSSRQANVNGNVILANVNASGDIDIRAGGDLQVTSLTSHGAGNNYGGTVGVIADNAGTSTNTFTVGGSGADSTGQVWVQQGPAGGGTIGIVSGGTGGINVANQAALILNGNGTGSGQGPAFGFNAKNGTLITPGSWNVNGNTQGNGGFLNFAGTSITWASPVSMSANAAGSGNGGSIKISGTDVALPATAATLSANGAGSAGQGGLIQVSSTNSTTVGSGGLTATAQGSGTGFGGSVTVSSNNNVDMGTGTVTLDASAAGGLGGTVTLSAGGGLNIGSAAVTLNANSTAAGAGSVTVGANSIATTSGSLTLNANATTYGGGNISFYTSSLTTGAGGVLANANSSGGYGGNINLQATTVTTGTGGVAFNANGALGGGFINGQIDKTSGQSNITLSADAAGNAAGSGGTVLLATSGMSSNLQIGSQPGQISINATGYATDGSTQNGGIVSVAAGGSLSVDGSGLNVATTATNGNGGSLSLASGVGGQGAVTVTGVVDANGTGTGTGGQISIASGDPQNPIQVNGFLVANGGDSGTGGTITFANTGQGALSVAVNGTVSATTTTGNMGTVVFQGLSNQDVNVNISSAGQIIGLVSAPQVQSFLLTQAAPSAVTDTGASVPATVTLGNIATTGGAIAIDVFGGQSIVSAGQGVIVDASTGTLAITSANITNNGSMHASTIQLITQTLTNTAGATVRADGDLTVETPDFAGQPSSSLTVRNGGTLQAGGTLAFDGTVGIQIGSSNGSFGSLLGSTVSLISNKQTVDPSGALGISVQSGAIGGTVVAQSILSVVLHTNGDLTVGNMSTSNGSISLSTDADLIMNGNLSTNVDVSSSVSPPLAGTGTISLQSTGGSIVVNGSLTANAYNPGGPVIAIFIGSNQPAQGQNTQGPSTFTVSGSGTVFFGSAGITVNGNATANLSGGAQVMFDSGGNASAITLNHPTITANVVQRNTLPSALDLSNPQTVALLEQEQAAGIVGGQLTATGGTLVLPDSLLSAPLTTLDIPQNFTVTITPSAGNDALAVALTSSSSIPSVKIDGVLQFGAPNSSVPSGLTVTSTGSTPALVIGSTGQLTSSTPLTVFTPAITNGGSIQVPSIAIHSDVVSNNGTISAGSISVLSGSPLNISGHGTFQLTGAGGSINLAVPNAGDTLTISGSHTFNLGTNGSLVIGGPAGSGVALTSGSNLSVVGSGTVAITTGNYVATGATWVLPNTASLTVAATTINTGSITGASNLSINAAQALTVDGAIAGTGQLSFTGGNVIVASNIVGSAVDVSSAGALSVSGNVIATHGSVSLVAGQGALTIGPGLVVSAAEGNLLLQNNDTARGTILVGSSSVLAATSATSSSLGQITLTIGNLPAVERRGHAPHWVSVHRVEDGKVYFGLDGISAGPPRNRIYVKSSTVMFNTGGRDASAIRLDGGVRIYAASIHHGDDAGDDNEDEGQYASRGHGFGAPSTPGLQNPQPGSDAHLQTPGFSTVTGRDSVSSAQVDAGSGTSQDNSDETVSNASPFAPVSYIETASPKDGDLRFACLGGARLWQCNASDVRVDRSKAIRIIRGNVILFAGSTTTVKSVGCQITVERGATVNIVSSEAGVSVRCLTDAHRGSVIVRTPDNLLTLASGQEAVVCPTRAALATELSHQPGLRRTVLQGGGSKSVATAEFSLVSLADKCEVLRRLLASDNQFEHKLGSTIKKTAACLMMVTTSHGGYSTP